MLPDGTTRDVPYAGKRLLSEGLRTAGLRGHSFRLSVPELSRRNFLAQPYAMTESPTAACLNCGRPLSGPYCAGCGQKKRDTDPTLREFLHETTAELAQWDGKIPGTLKTLFLKPGALTLDFLAGRRARWLSPCAYISFAAWRSS